MYRSADFLPEVTLFTADGAPERCSGVVHRGQAVDTSGRNYAAYRKEEGCFIEVFLCTLARQIGVNAPNMTLGANGNAAYSESLSAGYQPLANGEQPYDYTAAARTNAYEFGKIFSFLLWINRIDNHGRNFMIDASTQSNRRVALLDLEEKSLEYIDDIHRNLVKLYADLSSVFAQTGKQAAFDAGIKSGVAAINKPSLATVKRIIAKMGFKSGSLEFCRLNSLCGRLAERRGRLPDLVNSLAPHP